MIRETTMQAIITLRETNALSPMRLKVFEALCEMQETKNTYPTASELAKYMGITKGAQSNQNVVTRLGELKDMGLVQELDKKTCSITGFNAYAWKALPQDSPVKLEKPMKTKCPACFGKGFLETRQTKLF